MHRNNEDREAFRFPLGFELDEPRREVLWDTAEAGSLLLFGRGREGRAAALRTLLLPVIERPDAWEVVIVGVTSTGVGEQLARVPRHPTRLKVVRTHRAAHEALSLVEEEALRREGVLKEQTPEVSGAEGTDFEDLRDLLGSGGEPRPRRILVVVDGVAALLRDPSPPGDAEDPDDPVDHGSLEVEAWLAERELRTELAMQLSELLSVSRDPSVGIHPVLAAAEPEARRLPLPGAQLELATGLSDGLAAFRENRLYSPVALRLHRVPFEALEAAAVVEPDPTPSVEGGTRPPPGRAIQ